METEQDLRSVRQVTIPEQEYLDLLSSSRRLDALYAGGVNNWEGFDFAMEAVWDDEDD